MADDIVTMQQDAVRRVHEMRAKARSNLSEEPILPKEPKPEPKPSLLGGGSKMPLLSFIKDKEQIFLLLLIVLLLGEDCDQTLLLALLYICL